MFNGGLRFATADDDDIFEQTIAEIRCRIGYVWCESGLVPAPPMAEKIRAYFQLRGPFVELACAGHHPMLDQPLPPGRDPSDTLGILVDHLATGLTVGMELWPDFTKDLAELLLILYLSKLRMTRTAAQRARRLTGPTGI